MKLLLSILLLISIGVYYTQALTCADLRCSSCCTLVSGGVCFEPTQYTCVSQMLCPLSAPYACGEACYDPASYHCVSGLLQQGPETPKPVVAATNPPAVPATQAPVKATSAPATPAPVRATNAPVKATTPVTIVQNTPAVSPTILHGSCESRTDCAASGLQCCISTHPENGEVESECYDPAKFTCTEKLLCVKGLLGCNMSCYDPNMYVCLNGNQLAPKTSSNSVPATTAPVASTSKPVSASSAAPVSSATASKSSSNTSPNAPVIVHGSCESRTDCAASGLSCCVTTHPDNGESESECYDPKLFVCTPKLMCVIGMQGCGLSCYNPQYYTCNSNEQLVPKSR